MPVILKYLFSPENDKFEGLEPYHYFSKQLCLELLNKSMHDTFNMRPIIEANKLISNIKDLAKYKSKHINLSIMKFMKELINSGFTPYLTEIVNTNALDIIFEILEGNEGKKNIIYSVFLEIMMVICKKKNTKLIAHVFERNKDVILDIPILEKAFKLVSGRITEEGSILSDKPNDSLQSFFSVGPKDFDTKDDKEKEN